LGNEACLKNQNNELMSEHHSFGNIIENIILDETTRVPIWNQSKKGENAHLIFSLKDFFKKGDSKIKLSHLFILVEDKTGVLPLLGFLAPNQVTDFFLYNLSQSPKTLWSPDVYETIFELYLKKNSFPCWLVNTGFYGGPQGVGKKYEKTLIQMLISEILKNKIQTLSFHKDSVFSISIPYNLGGVDKNFLSPEKLWRTEQEYFEAALKTKLTFHQSLESRTHDSYYGDGYAF
jgi:phosphoenolpyruvate carboxykinase (ATP)